MPSRIHCFLVSEYSVVYFSWHEVTTQQLYMHLHNDVTVLSK